MYGKNKFEVISNQCEAKPLCKRKVSPEKMQRHFRNVTGSVLQDALNTWGEIWNELQGTVTHGYLISPEVEQGFKPRCGWPEFLEKMWLLKHHLDYAKRFIDGKE